jgi:hemerythrin
MANILKWRDAWTLHIDTLDDDHRQMVDRLVELEQRFGNDRQKSGSLEASGSVGDGAPDEDLHLALDRFGAFVRGHFQREEEFIRTIDYPGLSEQRSEHLLLMAEYTDFLRVLRESGIEQLGPQELETLKQWIVAHILGADRKFADYYFSLCD